MENAIFSLRLAICCMLVVGMTVAAGSALAAGPKPTNTRFTVLAGWPGDGSSFGYVWANDPSADRYHPSTTYSYNHGYDIVIDHLSTGKYRIVFESLGANAVGEERRSRGGHVQVSAYRSDSYCNVTRWNYRENGGEDFSVYVACYEPR